MKSLSLISALIFVSTIFVHHLWAGPVYAAKWKRGEQTVLLYGDQHDTHENDEPKERQAIDAFRIELEKAHNEGTKTLILCEDEKFSPSDKVYSDPYLYDPSWKKQFMAATCYFAYSFNNQYQRGASLGVQVRSIDPRLIFDMLEHALKYCSAPGKSSQLEKKSYEEIKDWSVDKILNWAICNLKFYAHFASDTCARKIFNEIAETFILRKQVLLKKIITDTRLSPEGLSQALETTLEQRIKKNDQKCCRLDSWLLDHGLSVYYNLEAVEAEALWHIVEMKPSCKKIVVIAGEGHLPNLEKYLLRLGFKKVASAGEDYSSIRIEYTAAFLAFKNVVDKDHALRVAPLSGLDEFGQSLFKKEILNSRKLFNKLEPEIRPKDQVLLQEKFYKARDKWDSFRIPPTITFQKKRSQKMTEALPLVSFETFKWINESEQATTKKRFREDGNDSEELLETKKMKPNPK